MGPYPGGVVELYREAVTALEAPRADPSFDEEISEHRYTTPSQCFDLCFNPELFRLPCGLCHPVDDEGIWLGVRQMIPCEVEIGLRPNHPVSIGKIIRPSIAAINDPVLQVPGIVPRDFDDLDYLVGSDVADLSLHQQGDVVADSRRYKAVSSPDSPKTGKSPDSRIF